MSNHMRDLVATATAWLVRTESPSCTAGPRRSFHGRLLAYAVSAACICGAGWYASGRLTWEDYSTHIGGKQTSRLADGSAVTLNTDTDLRVHIAAGSRDLALTRGEAIIKAVHDERRPVHLVVGATVIRTSGADFDVRKHANGQVDVLVSEGRVATETDEGWLSLPHSAGQLGIVSAGYMASIRPGDIEVSRLDTEELARRTAWLRDVLDFHGETLAQAAEDFNRYNTRKIVIDDPKIATRRVGGVFLDTDPESFVAALALTMDIRATTVEGKAGPGYGTIRLRSAQARR
jgi:transmembrane sensor